jgi:hypothetical protein
MWSEAETGSRPQPTGMGSRGGGRRVPDGGSAAGMVHGRYGRLRGYRDGCQPTGDRMLGGGKPGGDDLPEVWAPASSRQ